MKLQAEIGDDKYQLEIRRDRDKVHADIDGRLYEVEVSEPEPNVFLLKNQGKIYEVYVPPFADASGTTLVNVGAQQIEVRLIDPKRLRGSMKDNAHAGGLVEVKTAMPGKVVRILESPGAAVEKGQSVMVVEAMKMQNELKSPKDGVVKEIRVAEGSTVASGDVLATIE